MTCPVCGGNSFTDEWEGMVILLNETSELYEAMGAKKPWRYAINIK
ncbi:MAG: transcription elongation factor subunit Spt4 [Metallosphaera yellowstonensis]|nr:transcription elongation factor subunit Spt4 [Metallosphaera yellowstonensis]